MIFNDVHKGFVARVAAAAALLAVMIAAEPAHAATNNQNQETVPLTIYNRSGLPGTWYVLVTGQDNSTGQYWYVSDTSGDVSSFPYGTKPSYVSPYKQYGIAFTKKTAITLNVPTLTATRIYVSYGRKMWIQPTKGVPSTPNGWQSTDKNYSTLFDWAEYTWNDVAQPSNFQTSLNGNLTQVDMLGLPMLLEFAGASATKPSVVTRAGFSSPKSRSQIFAAFAAAGAPWSNLVARPGRGIPLRVNSPYNGMKAGVLPKNQLAGYINKVFSTYGSKTMVANTNAIPGPDVTFNGKVSGGNLVFTQEGNSANTVIFAKPTSNQAYSGYGPSNLAPNGTPLQLQGSQIGTMVQAGFMRGTMITEPTISACPGTSAYYVNAPVNMYAKIMHQYAYQHKAYGFGYDDRCNQSSDESVFDPTEMALTIMPIDGTKVKPKHKKKHWNKKHKKRHGKRNHHRRHR